VRAFVCSLLSLSLFFSSPGIASGELCTAIIESSNAALDLDQLNQQFRSRLFLTNLNDLLLEQQTLRSSRLRDLGMKVLPEFTNWLAERSLTSKKRRIEKLLTQFDPTSEVDRLKVDQFASSVVIEIFGSRLKLADLILAIRYEREKGQANELMREEILREGLRSLIAKSPLIERREWRSKFRLAWSKTARLKIAGVELREWLKLPFRLPGIGNHRLSPELFQALVYDGFESHVQDFRHEMDLQSDVDAYRLFRKYYTNAVIIGLLAFSLTYGREEQKAQFHSQVHAEMTQEIASDRSEGDQAQSLASGFKNQLPQTEIDRAITNFRLKYHSDPTADELEFIKTQIPARL
jgi:hypothetical protein